MTREEAIKSIQDFTGWFKKDKFIYEALEMAIKALSQECVGSTQKHVKNTLGMRCEDAISRQAVLDLLENTNNGWIINEVLQLPTVTPQEPKAGHWIMPVQDDGMSDPIYYQVRCSKCGFDLDPQTWHMELHQYGADKYCPKCGFRMVEPQERSDKE